MPLIFGHGSTTSRVAPNTRYPPSQRLIRAEHEQMANAQIRKCTKQLILKIRGPFHGLPLFHRTLKSIERFENRTFFLNNTNPNPNTSTPPPYDLLTNNPFSFVRTQYENLPPPNTTPTTPRIRVTFAAVLFPNPHCLNYLLILETENVYPVLN